MSDTHKCYLKEKTSISSLPIQNSVLCLNLQTDQISAWSAHELCGFVHQNFCGFVLCRAVSKYPNPCDPRNMEYTPPQTKQIMDK